MSSPQNVKIFGMDLGAEPKKVMALGGLLVLLLVVWFFTRNTDDGAVPPPSSSSGTAKAPPSLKGMADGDVPLPAGSAARGITDTGRPNGGPKRQGSRQALSASVKEFKVSLKRDKDNPIPSNTDPTIRLAELERVWGVGMAGGGRSLFDFGAMAPEAAKPGTLVASAKPKPMFPKYGPDQPGPLPGPPPDPPAPAIPLKFYGFVNSARLGEKRAFFMENEDIYIASEGEMMKNRYKLVKIGVNSVVLEDTGFKNNQQTIKLTEEAAGSN